MLQVQCLIHLFVFFRPNRSLDQTHNASTVLERSLILNKKKHKLKESSFWFGVNCTLLAIIVYDL